MKRIITLIVGLVIMGTIIGFVAVSAILQGGPKNFEECQARNYPVAESSPATCQTPKGVVFTEGKS